MDGYESSPGTVAKRWERRTEPADQRGEVAGGCGCNQQALL